MLPLLVVLLLAAPVDGPAPQTVASAPVPADSPRDTAAPVPAGSLAPPVPADSPRDTAAHVPAGSLAPPVPADSPRDTAAHVPAGSLAPPVPADSPRDAAAYVPAGSLAPPVPADSPRDAAAHVPAGSLAPPVPADIPRDTAAHVPAGSLAAPVPRDIPRDTVAPPPAVPPDSPPVDPAPVPPDIPPVDPAPVPPDSPPAPVAGEPTYRRDDPRPTLRAGFGAGFGPRSAPATGVGAGFSFDLAIGATIQVRRRVYLWPELGYSLALRDDRTGHFFIAGLSPMFGTYFAQIGLAPRLVAGSAWGVGGVGVRSGVVASVIQGLFSLELGHQWIRAGGRDIHDGRFMISVDLVVGAAAFVFARGVGRFLRKLG